MAITNTAFITFLALKNTPLGILTGYSYERLNQLHQVGGYTTVTFVCLHAILMLKNLSDYHILKFIKSWYDLHGVLAGCGMLVILVTAIFIRKMQYETFYIVHIFCFMFILINFGLHRPEFSLKATYIPIIIACWWSSDRILRSSRLLRNLYGTHAVVTALPHGVTRLVLHRRSFRAESGQHGFLWIPWIRVVETHPFTVASSNPNSIEFLISAHDGFTRSLHSYAMKNSGGVLKASFDGPYGALPNFTKTADKVILIAGGVGATFTFGVALEIIKKLKCTKGPTIEFIWTVKSQGMLDLIVPVWYSLHFIR